VRYITLSDDSAAVYEPGSVITWMQFSSARKGSEAASSFRDRNCKFIIWSIKGRHITRFSNYAEKEDEVLFMPFTRLLVIKREHSDGHYVIHLREVELGLTTKGLPLLWVDDNILPMKEMMQEAMIKAGRDIKYILKPSTHLALAFLESWFGLQVRKNGHFRVISDMNRPEEPESAHAGAILAREIWAREICVPIMIFTSDASGGLSKVGEKAPNLTARVLTSPEKGKPRATEVLITQNPEAVFVFCSYQGAIEKDSENHAQLAATRASAAEKEAQAAASQAVAQVAAAPAPSERALGKRRSSGNADASGRGAGSGAGSGAPAPHEQDQTLAVQPGRQRQRSSGVRGSLGQQQR
jgi:hypothetical protein